jgi:hypothetical protein
MDSFKGFFLPTLPPLPSIFEESLEIKESFKPSLRNENTNDCIASVSSNNFSSIESMFTKIHKEDSDSDDSDSTESINYTNLDEYKINKVIKTGQKLQKLIYINHCKGRTMKPKHQCKIKETFTEFLRMFLNDYHTDMYNYIVSILLDCKAMAKDFGYHEEKELIAKGLKMIQTKALIEKLPSGGAGGSSYWTGLD